MPLPTDMTVLAVADALNCSAPTVRQLFDDGKLSAHVEWRGSRRHLRFAGSDVQAFLDAHGPYGRRGRAGDAEVALLRAEVASLRALVTDRSGGDADAGGSAGGGAGVRVETAEILADPALMAAIREGLADAAAGRTYSHGDVAEEVLGRQWHEDLERGRPRQHRDPGRVLDPLLDDRDPVAWRAASEQRSLSTGRSARATWLTLEWEAPGQDGFGYKSHPGMHAVASPTERPIAGPREADARIAAIRASVAALNAADPDVRVMWGAASRTTARMGRSRSQ